MSNGVGLGAAFNQDGADNNNPHEKLDAQGEAFQKDKKKHALSMLKHIKVGNTVSYSKGEGKVVKKDGAYLTIYNESAGKYDQVHAGETYVPGDTISMGIMNQLWDQMTQETRISTLHKARVAEPLHFVSRSWDELPPNLKEVIKMPQVNVGGKQMEATGRQARSWNTHMPKDQQNNPSAATTIAGKEIAANDAKHRAAQAKPEKKPSGGKESRTFGARLSSRGASTTNDLAHAVLGNDARDLAPKKKSDPVTEDLRGNQQSKEGQASAERLQGGRRRAVPGVSSPGLTDGPLQNATQRKSDVEHGAYGGVTTDTSFDAKEEYEGDEREGERAQTQLQDEKKPKDTKEGGKEVMVGFHEKAFINKYNTRYGPRQVTPLEAEAFLEKSKPKTVYTQSREGQKDKITPDKTESAGDTSGGKSRGSSTDTRPKGLSHSDAGMSSTGEKDKPMRTSYRGKLPVKQIVSDILSQFHNPKVDKAFTLEKLRLDRMKSDGQLTSLRYNRLLKGAESDLKVRTERVGDTKTPSTSSNPKDFSTGSALRGQIQHNPKIFPKPTDGKRMGGTASNKPSSQTFNPTGDKDTSPGHNSPNVADAGSKLGTSRTGRDVSAKLEGPRYYVNPKKTPGRSRSAYDVSTEKEKEKLRNTPGKDVDRVHGEMKDRKRQSQEKRRATEERNSKHDNKQTPGDKKEHEGKVEQWKKRRNEDRNRKEEESNRDASSPGAYAQARSRLSHASERRSRQRIGAERKEGKESYRGGTTRQRDRRAKPDKDTKYYDTHGDKTSKEDYKNT